MMEVSSGDEKCYFMTNILSLFTVTEQFSKN